MFVLLSHLIIVSPVTVNACCLSLRRGTGGKTLWHNKIQTKQTKTRERLEGGGRNCLALSGLAQTGYPQGKIPTSTALCLHIPYFTIMTRVNLNERRRSMCQAESLSQLFFFFWGGGGGSIISWCFTPSQPMRLYQGERERNTEMCNWPLSANAQKNGRSPLLQLVLL